MVDSEFVCIIVEGSVTAGGGLQRRLRLKNLSGFGLLSIGFPDRLSSLRH